MNLFKYLISKKFREEFSKDTIQKFHLVELQMEHIYNKESFTNEKRDINVVLNESNECECASCRCCAA